MILGTIKEVKTGPGKIKRWTNQKKMSRSRRGASDAVPDLPPHVRDGLASLVSDNIEVGQSTPRP